MDRSFMYWFMVPFIGAGAILVGTGILAPHLLSGDLLLPILAAMLTFGFLARLRTRSSRSAPGAPGAKR